MASFGTGRRILFIGGEGVALFAPTARGIEREASFSWELPNFNEQLTAALLRQHRSNSVLVLFDAADQTYRKEENVPKLSFMDRPKFIQRKLEQGFPNYPIRMSIEIPPPKGSGKQPSYLFVAIPETERLDKVGASLLEAGVPIAGFGVLPLESRGLVTTLAEKTFGKKVTKSRWAVLVGQHETGGLRQVVVKDGNLALTRLTPVSEGGLQGQGWVNDVMRELKATLTYIARFGYTAEEGLDVIVIAGEDDKMLFDAKELPITNFRSLSVPEALLALGSRISATGKTNFGDAVHAAWASRKRSIDVPVMVPSIHRIMMPRLSAWLGSLLLVISFIVVAGLTTQLYLEYTEVQEDIALKQNQKAMLDREYAEETKVFDALPVKPDVARGTLAIKKVLDDNSVNIAPTLNTLRKSINNDFRMNNLRFEFSSEDTFKASGPVAGRARPAPKKPGESNKGTVKIGFSVTLIGGLTLELKVARAERLAETLRLAFPGYDVQIKKQFGNISRTGKFQGTSGQISDTKVAVNEADAADFEMEGAPL